MTKGELQQTLCGAFILVLFSLQVIIHNHSNNVKYHDANQRSYVMCQTNVCGYNNITVGYIIREGYERMPSCLQSIQSSSQLTAPIRITPSNSRASSRHYNITNKPIIYTVICLYLYYLVYNYFGDFCYLHLGRGDDNVNNVWNSNSQTKCLQYCEQTALQVQINYILALYIKFEVILVNKHSFSTLNSPKSDLLSVIISMSSSYIPETQTYI